MNSLRKVVFSRTLPDEPGWNAGGANPRMLGSGAPLFRGNYERFPLQPPGARAHDNGIVMLYYQTVRG